MMGVGIILLLVVVAVGIFLATFDANQYKQDLSDLVNQETGRNLDFQGDIGLTLYPSLGMKLGSMTFSNASGFGDKPMLSVNEASVSVDVLSILSFQPQIAELVLDGLTVDLQKNKQGKTNWDDLLGDTSEMTETPEKADESEKSEAGDQQINIIGAFGGLNITHANLSWTDQSTGDHYQIQDLSLKTGRIEPQKAFPVEFRMAVESLNDLKSSIALDAEVLIEQQEISLSTLKLEVMAQGKLVPVDQLQLALGGEVNFSLKTSQLDIKGFNTKIHTSGGVLHQADVSIAGDIGFDVDRSELTITLLDMQAELQGDSVPNGQMKAGLSASKLGLKLNKRSVTLDDLVLALNENRFKGFVKVLDYDQPAVNFELASDRFDVDKLIGYTAPVEQPEQPVDEAAPAEDVQIELPMELLRSLKMDGKLGIGTLIAQGLTINDFLLKVDADKGIVDLKPLSMNLYEGSFDAAIQINAKGEKPVYKISKKLSSLQMGKFLKDFMGEDTISGKANMDVNLTTRGDWLSKLKSNLNGKLAISLEDGALKGFNLRHSIESARAKLKGNQAPELVERKTDFSAMSISGVIRDGVFSSDDLNMQAPVFRVGGKGSADLAQETVDYLVNAKLVTTTKGQQGGSAEDISGLPIPVAITGPWASPKIDVQYDEMLKAKFEGDKAKIRQQVDKEKAAIKAKLADQKARLKQVQEKEATAKKAQLDAKKKIEEEKAKKKLQDKLKKLF